MRKGIPLAAGDQEAPRPTCRLGVENSLSSTKARTVTITQPHGGHSKQVATHGEENMNYHRKKKQYLNSILSRIQKKLVQICLTSSGFRKIREKFTRGGQTYMKISQCWVRKGKLKTLQRNQHSPQGHGKSSPRNMQRYAQTTALRTTLSKDEGDEQREGRV